jgi:hypothetical protein
MLTRWIQAVMLMTAGLALVSCGSSSSSGSSSHQKTSNTHTKPKSAPLSSTQAQSTNLTIPPSVRRHLHDVLASVRESDLNHEHIVQALPGTVYYARFNGDYYALAAFDVPKRGTTDQPSLFAKYGSDPWTYLGNNLGDIATVGALPCPVRDGWGHTCTTPAPTTPTSHRAFVADVYASCAAIQHQLNTYGAKLSAHPQLLARLRDQVGRLAVLQLTPTDRPVRDRLLTLYAHQIGLLSWVDESHAIGNKRATLDAEVESQLTSNHTGDFLYTHGIPHCFHS